MKLAAVTLAITLALAALLPAAADARRGLSKRDARAQGLAFADPFADMLDPLATVHANMVPASQCKRIDRLTVSCRFRVRLVSEPRTVYSHVRVHLQRDGFYGILLPLNIWKNTARQVKRRGLAELGQISTT